MKKNLLLLRPFAVWLVVAGLLTLITTASVTFYFQVLSSLVGFISLLFLVFLAAYEMTAFRSVWIAQVGEWGNIIKVLGVSVLVRAVLLSLTYSGYDESFVGNKLLVLDVLFILNVVSILIESGGLAFIYVNKQFFLPSKQEIDLVMKRLKAVGTTTVSECPACKQVVEADWCCCPTCGTELPRFCAACKAPVGATDKACASCGTEIVRSISVQKMIQTMRETADQPALPETRSVRFARYAESLLKGGQVDEAIEAYRKAIQYTKFVRKQTNFLVKMATIYKNTGRKKEAADLLNAALELDQEDIAGARKALDKLFT
ncbi:MAG: tetratricopeptide repeat protein, partial [Euryarchaeota archaeon]|nr:tetratricopeptide repeat protein [Euryarchaeota archaeon]